MRIPGVRQHRCCVFQSLWTVWSYVGKWNTADLSANGMHPCRLTRVHRVAGGDLNNIQLGKSVAGSTSRRILWISISLQQHKLQSDKATVDVQGTCKRACAETQIQQSARLLPANWRQEALIHSRPLINHDLMGGKQRDVISSKALNTALNSTSEDIGSHDAHRKAAEAMIERFRNRSTLRA